MCLQTTLRSMLILSCSYGTMASMEKSILWEQIIKITQSLFNVVSVYIHQLPYF